MSVRHQRHSKLSTRIVLSVSKLIPHPFQLIPPPSVLMTSPETVQFDPRRWLALVVVLCATLLGVLDFLIVNIAMVSIKKDLGTTDAQVQLTVAGYGLAFAVCLITSGRLGDIYGRKKLFLIGMTGFTFASALCGAAHSPNQLIGFRILQGLLASAMSPQVLSIIQVSFPPEEKSLAFAIMGAITSVGSFIGNVFGGWLVGANLFGLGWRPIFFVNLPIGIGALIAAWFLVRESKAPQAKSLDWIGVLLSGIGLFLLIFPLAEGREKGWPLWAFGCLAASVTVLCGFFAYEKQLKRRGGSPLVDVDLFQDRAFSSGLSAVLSLFSGMGAFALTLTLFLQSGFKVSPQHTGLIFAPLPVGFLLASLLSVKIAQRVGPRILMWGLAVSFVAQAIMIAWIVGHGAGLNPYSLMPILFLYGMGQGATVPRLIGTVLTNVAPQNAGAASGVLTTTQQVAFAIGVSVLGSVFFSGLGKLGDSADAATYVRAFATVLTCNLALMTTTMFLLLKLTRVASLHTTANHEVVTMEV